MHIYILNIYFKSPPQSASSEGINGQLSSLVCLCKFILYNLDISMYIRHIYIYIYDDICIYTKLIYIYLLSRFVLINMFDRVNLTFAIFLSFTQPWKRFQLIILTSSLQFKFFYQYVLDPGSVVKYVLVSPWTNGETTAPGLVNICMSV